MIDSFSIQISKVRFFLGMEISKMDSFSIDRNRCRPFFCLFWLCKSFCCSVLGIYKTICRTKIAYSIIGSDSIYMINHIRQITITNLKCNSMSITKIVFIVKNYISIFVDATNLFCWVFSSIKKTRFLIVDQFCKINDAHVFAPIKQLIEKWRLGVPALSRCAIVMEIKNGSNR